MDDFDAYTTHKYEPYKALQTAKPEFHSWFDSELHRKKYTTDHPAYLAAQEAWNAANDAAQHRINCLNAEIEAWKTRFKIAEDALAKRKGPETVSSFEREEAAVARVRKFMREH